MDKYKKTLNEVVDAWESLPGDMEYSPSEIQDWILNDLYPVVQKARNILNRDQPKVKYVQNE